MFLPRSLCRFLERAFVHWGIESMARPLTPLGTLLACRLGSLMRGCIPRSSMALLWCCSTLAPPAQDHGSFQMRNCRACGTVFGPKELVPDIKFCTVDSVGHFSPAEHLTQTAAVNRSLVKTQSFRERMPWTGHASAI